MKEVFRGNVSLKSGDMLDLTFSGVRIYVTGLFPLFQFTEVFCKMFASGKFLMNTYMAVSSAKSLTLDMTCLGESFM